MENRKVHCALKHGFTPLLCVGETLAQKEAGIADEIIRIQLKVGLQGVSPEQAQRLYIAYEPVWAIGINGQPASKEYASDRHSILRETLCELYGAQISAQIPLLYGGSVNPDNAQGPIMAPEIDGLFIGRSAWHADCFDKLIRLVLQAEKKTRRKISCESLHLVATPTRRN